MPGVGIATTISGGVAWIRTSFNERFVQNLLPLLVAHWIVFQSVSMRTREMAHVPIS